MNITQRDQIMRLEAAMREQPQLEIPAKHLFAHGIYAREILIPKGTILTGKIHRYSHINIISKGDISVATPDGNRRIIAPCTFVAPAGTKRAGYAHEDTIWTTVHACTQTEIELVEHDLIVDTFELLERQPCLS